METTNESNQPNANSQICSFCKKELLNDNIFIQFDIHALAGAQVCLQEVDYGSRTKKQGAKKTSFFTPITQMKACICNKCHENNMQCLKAHDKSNRKVYAVISTVLFLAFIVSLIFSIIGSIGIALPIILGVVFLIPALLLWSSFLPPNENETIICSQFIDTDVSYKNFIKSMNSKINLDHINFSSYMFGEKTGTNKRASLNQNLLYIYDFDNNFGRNIFAWFKYEGRYWYKTDWNHSLNTFIGYNAHGVPDRFRLIFCLDTISPQSIFENKIAYENNNSISN